MNIEKKLGSLKEYVRSRANIDAEDILKDAKKHAEEIKKDYAVKAESHYNEIVEKAKRDAELLLRREVSQASAKCSKMLMDARNEILRSAVDELREKLNKITESKEYTDFLKRTLVEAIRILGEKKVVVKVRKKDKVLVKKILTALEDEMKDVEIKLSKEDAAIAGGVVVETEDSRMIIENTLENKFEEIKERFSSALFSKLKS